MKSPTATCPLSNVQPISAKAHALAFGLLLGALSSTSGCATLAGLTTGAFTGAVDAPAEVYRHHRGEFDRNPIYHGFNVAFFVPLGIIVGPLAGMGKGLSLDVQW